jgi:hypothetical protein
MHRAWVDGNTRVRAFAFGLRAGFYRNRRKNSLITIDRVIVTYLSGNVNYEMHFCEKI